LASEVLKIRGDALSEDRFANARRRLASFLGGVFAGAHAAGDEVVAGIEVHGVDFAALADKRLRQSPMASAEDEPPRASSTEL
jgi:hypothetical protein